MLETRKFYEGGDRGINETEFTGVLSGNLVTIKLLGDGVSSNSLYTLGRYVGFQWCAENSIRESLFRIECKLNYTKGDNFDRQQKLIAQFPEKYEKTRWNEAMKESQNESQTNTAELKQKKGSQVQYGQIIQLRHLFTGNYISVATDQISKEGGTQRVELAKGSEKVWVEFMPGTKTAKVGDIVRYGDSIVIMSKADQDNNYLHASNCSPLAAVEKVKISDESYSEHRVFMSEVNAGVLATHWRARLCADHRDLGTKENTVKVGDMFKLYHVNSECHLTVSKRDTNVQLMQKLREDPRSVALEVFLSNFQENEAALCWQLERTEEFVGGWANWDGFYRLRHVLTGMYLTYIMQRGEFRLASGTNMEGTVIQLYPINVIASMVCCHQH